MACAFYINVQSKSAFKVYYIFFVWSKLTCLHIPKKIKENRMILTVLCAWCLNTY